MNDNDDIADSLALDLLDPSGNLLVSAECELSRDSRSEYANSYWDDIPSHARNEKLYSIDVKDSDWVEHKNRLIADALIYSLTKTPEKVLNSLREAGYQIKFPDLLNDEEV